MEAEVFGKEAFETGGICGIMHWNFNIPGGHRSLNMSRRELERCPLTYFLGHLPKEKDMFMATWDPVLEDGVRFWFDGMNKPDGQGLPPAAALSWMKILNRLARELKHVPSELALSRFCGKVKWEISRPWCTGGYGRDINLAAAEMGRRMLPFMKSESARKIESDLSGNMFISDAWWKGAFYEKDLLQTGNSMV